MKHQIIFLRMAFLVVSFFGIQSFAQAQSEGLIASNKTVSKIQFVGLEGEMLIFDLRLSNLPSKGSWIRIMDDDKNLLFEHRTNATTYRRRFKIVRENLKGIHFEVTNKETILKESFRLKYKVEEKMEVIKA